MFQLNDRIIRPESPFMGVWRVAEIINPGSLVLSNGQRIMFSDTNGWVQA